MELSRKSEVYEQTFRFNFAEIKSIVLRELNKII